MLRFGHFGNRLKIFLKSFIYIFSPCVDSKVTNKTIKCILLNFTAYWKIFPTLVLFLVLYKSQNFNAIFHKGIFGKSTSYFERKGKNLTGNFIAFDCRALFTKYGDEKKVCKI